MVMDDALALPIFIKLYLAESIFIALLRSQ